MSSASERIVPTGFGSAEIPSVEILNAIHPPVRSCVLVVHFAVTKTFNPKISHFFYNRMHLSFVFPLPSTVPVVYPHI